MVVLNNAISAVVKPIMNSPNTQMRAGLAELKRSALEDDFFAPEKWPRGGS
jgi:hypothetical protein